ncbi:MAG TPA: glycosyltransferase [Acidimicrobiales bacterium]|jgi:glycosyltransferase involved in cell wall biosynthesis|nr:glycosyltransferase [Acidimicrobiales bacterium]
MELVNARLLERLAAHVDLEVVAGDGLETLPPGVRRTHVPIPRRPSVARLVLFDLLGTLRLLAVRRRCDLVHTCGAVVHARPDVVTMHLSHAAVIEAQGGARPPGRTGMGGAIGALRRRVAAAMERWALRPGRARRLVAISRADAADLAARYPDVELVLIENGIDVEAPRDPAARSTSPALALEVVVVAGDFERKGIALAIRAVSRTARCRLRVVGDGDLAAMRELARSLGAADRVELLGHRSDVWAELWAADVVLSCSAHESFGLAVAEGAAAGCAVVCTNTGVGPELCADVGGGPGGVVVDADERAISGALERLDADRATCRAMGAIASSHASRYSWDAMAASTLAVYDELIKQGP